jgi:hypothetical protein
MGDNMNEVAQKPSTMCGASKKGVADVMPLNME